MVLTEISSVADDRLKVVCLDMDGTLLNCNNEVPKENAKALASLTSHNIKAMLVSGRHRSCMERYAEELNLTDVPIISCNGALGKLRDEVLFRNAVPKDVVEATIAFCEKHNLQFNWYTDDEVYAVRNGDPLADDHMRRYREMTGAKPIVIESVREETQNLLRGPCPLKVLFFAPDERLPSLLGEFREYIEEQDVETSPVRII